MLAATSRSGVTVGAALRDYRFWVIALSILCVAIGVGGSITNFQPLLMDRGFRAQEAAKIAGVIGVSVIVGRLVAGYLIDRYFGLANHGRLYGLQYSVFGFASGISPFLFGKVFDVTGSYQPILYVAAVLFVLGAFALLTLGRYPRFDASADA